MANNPQQRGGYKQYYVVVFFGFVWLQFLLPLLPTSNSFVLGSPPTTVQRSADMVESSRDLNSSENNRKRWWSTTTTFRSSSLGDGSGDEHFHEQDDDDAVTAETTKDSLPRFTVGVIADIQYAPIPDGTSYSGTPRYYRHALEVARHASEHFEQEQVDLVLNLGDTIDGKCQQIVENGGDPVPNDADPGHFSLDHVLEALSSYKKGPIIHTYGNHCLYNLDRLTLAQRLGIPFIKEPCGDLVGYFYHVYQGVRFVVIDSYDVAIMQRCEQTSAKHREASEILNKNNPNYPENMNAPEGLEGVQRRFVGFNGAVGQLQLSWLRQTLQEARTANEKVVVVSHQPIMPDSSNEVCLIWNYEDVLEILRDHADVVVASFSGHAHKGGYVRDPQSGIHFRVFEAALENRPERTYAMVDVHEDRLTVRGFGNCQSAVYDFEHTRELSHADV